MSTPSKNPEPKESSMKKRILSLALTLCLLAGLLPCLTMGAAAASRGGCRAVCGRGVYAEFRREDGHGPLYLPGAGLYRSVPAPSIGAAMWAMPTTSASRRASPWRCRTSASTPRRRARRLLAQRRPLRHALCHDAGGCCLQRRDVQQDLARRGHRALRRRRGQATGRRSITSTAIRPTATMS